MIQELYYIVKDISFKHNLSLFKIFNSNILEHIWPKYLLKMYLVYSIHCPRVTCVTFASESQQTLRAVSHISKLSLAQFCMAQAH